MGSLHTQVSLLNHRVLAEVGGGVLQYDLSGLQYVAASGDGKRHQGILLNEQDRRSLFVDALDGLEDGLYEDGSETHRRLIHQQDSGVSH